MREIVIATRNGHKLAEIRAILAEAGFLILGLDEFDGAPDVEEDGATFEANAAKKAEAAARATGRVAVADDSGLVVEALGGAPGVMSARYAGAGGDGGANNALLLRELDGVPDGRRTARFVCVVAAARTGRRTRLFRGDCGGRIIRELRGEAGFGYDPLFFSDELGMTFAEAAPGEKNRASHRGRALALLREALASGEFDDWFTTDATADERR